MLAGELRLRQAKLEKEQRERTERERQRLERERVAQERARAREAARDEEARLKRLAQLQAEEQESTRHADEVEANGGVWLQRHLQSMPLDEATAAAKGIRRAKDKIVLPPSMGNELTDQGASRFGALLFELQTAGGRVCTHAGVLEFTAPEGTVMLPPKVMSCLAADGHISTSTSANTQPQAHIVSGTVIVTYRRLPKATYVRLQPLEHGFHEQVGSSIREVLEDALHAYCTLTEGDIITIPHASFASTSMHASDSPQPSTSGCDGNASSSHDPQLRLHKLLVQKLQPAHAASVIDTEVEAEVVPSVEAERYLAEREAQEKERAVREEAERQRLAVLAVQRAAEEQAVAEAAAALAAREAQQAAEAAAAQAASSIARLAALQDALLPEPSADAAKSTYATCLFRLPDGHRISRRFLLSHPQAQLYTFVDSMGGGGLQPGSYQLVAQFPRRVIPSPGASYAPHTLPESQSGGMYSAAASQQLQLRQADVHMQDAGQQHASNAAGGIGSAPGSHEAVVGDILSGGAQEAFLLEPLEPLPAQTVTG